jgi:hypothetical protein
MGVPRKVSWLLALSAVAALGVGFFVFNEPLEFWLDCNRASGACTFTQKLLGRSRVKTVPVESMHTAELRTGMPRRSIPRTSVWVTTDRGDYFFADYRRRADAEAASEEINAFLKDPTRGRFRITWVDKTMYWIAWGLVPVVALFVVAVASALSARRQGPQAQPRQPSA